MEDSYVERLLRVAAERQDAIDMRELLALSGPKRARDIAEVVNPNDKVITEYDTECFRQLGFEITTLLGAGGYHVVMNGVEIATGTPVAIKLATYTREVEMSRYAAEKNIGPRILATVPCIVNREHTTAMVMEKFDATLERYIVIYIKKYHRMVPLEVFERFRNLLEAQYAANFVHGDFHFANVLVKYDAQTLAVTAMVLSDFPNASIEPQARLAFWKDWDIIFSEQQEFNRDGLLDKLLEATIGYRRNITGGTWFDETTKTWTTKEPRT